MRRVGFLSSPEVYPPFLARTFLFRNYKINHVTQKNASNIII